MRSRIRTLLIAAIFFMATVASTTERRMALTGKVVDLTGRPVDHAAVLVYQAGVRTGYSTYCPTCYADCGKRTITASDGSYRIKGLSPDLKFTLLVVRDGYFSEFVKSVDPLQGPAPNAILKTRQPVNDPQMAVRGRIVDFRGRPLRDAIVQPKGILYNDEKRGRIAAYGTVGGLDLIAVTNDKGEFEISYDRPALKLLLLVEARGFAPKIFNELSTGLDRKTLTVGDGATVRGQLICSGRPLAGAQMGLVPRQRGMGAELKLYGNPYEELRVGTKSDGTFVFTNVPVPVEWYAYAKMESISGHGATVPIECSTKRDGEDVDVGEILIKPGYRLRGIVVLSDGKPIGKSMRVTIGADKAADTQTIILRSDGKFEFSDLAPGKYQVFASVKGYRAPTWDYKTRPDPPGTVQIEHDVDDFVLTMDPAKQ
jgi:protocatechuate 3,4-dioxygenase beta subunit